MSRTWMPLYVGDYLKATAHLTAAEHGAYMLLIMHYWSNASLPNDDKRLAMIARLTPDEWRESRAVLSAFFNPDWTHDRIEGEIAKASEAYDRRAAAGRKGGLAKASVELEQSHSNAKAEEVALPKQSSSYSSLRSEVKGEGREREAAFDGFWAKWPNRVAKPDAKRAFEKVWRESEAILAGIDAYVANKPADRAWMHPSTFLNQRRWEDAPAPVEARAGPPATIHQFGTKNGKPSLSDFAIKQERNANGHNGNDFRESADEVRSLPRW